MAVCLDEVTLDPGNRSFDISIEAPSLTFPRLNSSSISSQSPPIPPRQFHIHSRSERRVWWRILLKLTTYRIYPPLAFEKEANLPYSSILFQGPYPRRTRYLVQFHFHIQGYVVRLVSKTLFPLAYLDRTVKAVNS